MFGYVRPRTDELRLKDYDRYRAAYCGLCRALGKQYGFPARFLVNYDLTFLYLLRTACEPAAETGLCWCPARVCGRKRCIRDPEGYAPVADATVILCYHKLQDTIRDSGFFRRTGARILKCLYTRAYRRASRRRPELAALAREQMQILAELEREKCPGIDGPADAFASMIRGCAADIPQQELRRPMETVLYHVGRYLYLCDALDDLKQDLKTDSYNPLRYRFEPEENGLKEADSQYLTQLMDSTLNLAGAALALLPARSSGPLLENIIYLGLPAVYSGVRAGRFHKNKRESLKGVNP